MGRFPEIDVKKLKTHSIRSRRSKVRSAASGKPPAPGASFNAFWKGLPDVLAVRELRELVGRTAAAVRRKKPVLLLSGAHVIKVGLSPVVIRLMEKGVVSGVAFNGAGAVHDAELAYFGATSEEVGSTIRNGRFGMARETAGILNGAASQGAAGGLGFGEALGRRILMDAPPFVRSSILAQAARLGVPVTVHVAMGTDIVHPHPSADGAAIGETSLRDFRILAEQVSRLGNGGVVLLFGSAVVLPEVFLKALSTARNIRGRVTGFFTASFDMHRPYRPTVNVVERPTADGGKGYTFTGHHEIMMPLFASAVLEALFSKSRGRGR
ncbi:hypothetical protein JW777_04315 [bacterium]|nr:hypothetical protein [bacterium]